MKRIWLIPLKFRLSTANLIANLIGVLVINELIFRDFALPGPDIYAKVKLLDWTFTPFAFIAVAFCTILYERPIYAFIDQKLSGQPIEVELSQKTCRRLLNYPFFVMGVDIAIWGTAGIVYVWFFWIMGVRLPLLLRPVFISLNTGFMTATIVFFLTEHIMQRHFFPYLFPNESLAATPGTLRIKIGMRMVMILIACNLIPLSAVLQAVYLSKGAIAEAAIKTDRFYAALSTNAYVFMALGFWVVWFVGLNMTIPFREIVRVLRGIKNGQLDRRIQVKTNDEIGYTGEVINEMAEGLQEGEQMRQALALAREVQVNLLPKMTPSLKSIDIAGRSIYCDQTGGDYFDFLEFDDAQKGKIGLVVGDVSGHGVSSALLMTTARAFLRFRLFMPGSISHAMTDVNRQLAKDMGDSGQFMTLFYLVMDPNERTVSWVRAGHDPAILYDPANDTFESLDSTGMALGVLEDCWYEEKKRTGLEDGQIIVIGTDGIWEAFNAKGEMFGKAKLFDIIRRNHHADAEKIVDAVIEALDRFLGGHKAEDDITLIVVRVAGDAKET